MSVTLKTARQALGREVGGWIPAVANAGSQTSATVPEAFASSTLPSSALAYRWLFSPSSAVPRQRRITATGLNSGTGAVSLDGALGTAIANGTPVELSSYLPVEQQNGNFGQAFEPGLHECLNWGARHLLVPQDDYEVMLVSGQHDYSVATWLDSPERLKAVRRRNPTNTAWVDETIHEFKLHEGADGPILRFTSPYRFSPSVTPTPTIRLAVLRPADTWIKVGGFWTDSTAGATNETDEYGVDLNSLIPVALAYAYQAIRNARTGSGRATFDALYERQVQLARRVKNYDTRNDIDSTVRQAAPGPAPVAADSAA